MDNENDLNKNNNSQKVSQKKTPSKKRSAIKTYRDYAAESLKGDTKSLAELIIQEKRKKEEKQRNSPKRGKNVLLIFLSSVFVIIGVVTIFIIIYFVQIKNQQDEIDSAPVQAELLIDVEFRSEIDLENINVRELTSIFRSEIEGATVPVSEIKLLYFTNKNQFGRKVLSTAGDFLEKITSRQIGPLIRSLGPHFNTGIYSGIDNYPFLIFEVDVYSTFFPEILNLEEHLLSTLGVAMGVPFDHSGKGFSDLVLFNQDTRVVLNEEAKIVFGYSFIGKDKVVFFTDEQALREVLNRLEDFHIRH